MSIEIQKIYEIIRITVIGRKMRIGKQSLIGQCSSLETVGKVGTGQLRKLLAGYKRTEK